MLKDLDTVEKRLEKAKKQSKSGDKAMVKQVETLEKLKNHIEAFKPARSFTIPEDQKEVFRDLHLLTSKPVLYVANVKEDEVNSGNEHVNKLKDSMEGENA